jgi:hypothetical protein
MALTIRDITEFLQTLGPYQGPGDILLLEVRKTKMGNKLKAKFAVPAIPAGYANEVVASRFTVSVNGEDPSVTDVPVGTPFFDVTFLPPANLHVELSLVDDEGNLSANTKTATYNLTDTVPPPDAGDIALASIEEVVEATDEEVSE